MDGWDWIPYPFLTKESVPGEYGPGHNSFVKDPENGDDLMVYHAVPHDENDKHWGGNRYPPCTLGSNRPSYLEMTEDRDLDPKFKNITLKITVK